MSLTSTLINGALLAVSVAFPQAAAAIAIVQALEPYAEVAIPVIRAAIEEGPAAFAAAKTAAPEFFSKLTALASELKVATGADPADPVSDEELAHLAAHVAGIDPPGWTHAETIRWWDKASGDR